MTTEQRKPLVAGGVWITEAWLRANGFRLQSRRDRQPTDHYRRDLGDEVLGGRPFMGSSDDLCIEVAKTCGGSDCTTWHCWIFQVEPCRHIHVRDVSSTWELAKLYEGLTGVPFKDEMPSVAVTAEAALAAAYEDTRCRSVMVGPGTPRCTRFAGHNGWHVGPDDQRW